MYTDNLEKVGQVKHTEYKDVDDKSCSVSICLYVLYEICFKISIMSIKNPIQMK